jgi:3-deoxy-D-manno-octulosonate 8-phosphate phosphatase (KDO 8-P phosphatase)
LAGIQACPSDAAIDLKNSVDYISPLKGGEGCARDVIEKVMKLRGDWETDSGIKAQ